MATRALVDSTGTGLAKATDGCHTEAGSLRVIPGFHLPGLFPRFRPASGGVRTCFLVQLPSVSTNRGFYFLVAPPDSWHLPHNVSPPPFWTGLGWDCGCEHTTTRSHSVSHTTSHSQSVSQKTSHSAPHSTTHRSTSHSHTTSPHSKSTTKKSTYTHKPTSIHTTAKKPKPTTSPNWHCNGSGTDGTE